MNTRTPTELGVVVGRVAEGKQITVVNSKTNGVCKSKDATKASPPAAAK